MTTFFKGQWSNPMTTPPADPLPATVPADVTCEHGMAVDVHCCRCRRSGFFPPDDCDCFQVIGSGYEAGFDAGYAKGYADGLDEGAGDPRVERIEAGFAAIHAATNGEYSRDDMIVMDALQAGRDFAVNLARREQHIQQLIEERASLERQHAGELIELIREKAQIHGRTCAKKPHDNTAGGYLHSENDDTPYDVDGWKYCGRCHRVLESHP